MSFGDADPNFLMLDGPFTDAGFAALAGLTASSVSACSGTSPT